MFNLDTVTDNIRNFFEEHRTAALITALIVLLFLLGITGLVIYSNTDKPAPKVYAEQPLEADQKLILPPGPSVPQGYALTREQKEKWTEEESKENFTLPDVQALNSLKTANDRMVNDILGAAP